MLGDLWCPNNFDRGLGVTCVDLEFRGVAAIVGVPFSLTSSVLGEDVSVMFPFWDIFG